MPGTVFSGKDTIAFETLLAVLMLTDQWAYIEQVIITGMLSIRMETLRERQEYLTGGLIQLIGGGGGARGGFLEAVALKLKDIPKGKGGERKGTDRLRMGRRLYPEPGIA